MSRLASPTRRRLLKALAASPLALSAPSLAAGGGKQRLLVLVFLYGGNDGFNTWVPFTDGLYYRKRPNIAVPRDSVLKITDRHGLHPSMASLMPLWEGRELAIVQGIGYPEATQQHYRDIEIAFSAADTEIRDDGWVTRALAPRGAADAVAFDVLDIRELDPMGPIPRGEARRGAGALRLRAARQAAPGGMRRGDQRPGPRAPRPRSRGDFRLHRCARASPTSLSARPCRPRCASPPPIHRSR